MYATHRRDDCIDQRIEEPATRHDRNRPRCLFTCGDRQKSTDGTARGVWCSNWSRNQVPARARNPPTRDAREARSFMANGLSLRDRSHCLIDCLRRERHGVQPTIVEEPWDASSVAT
jgi:hypothetical protein